MSETITDTEVAHTLVWMRLQLITPDPESSEMSYIYYLYPETGILYNRNGQLVTDFFYKLLQAKILKSSSRLTKPQCPRWSWLVRFDYYNKGALFRLANEKGNVD